MPSCGKRQFTKLDILFHIIIPIIYFIILGGYYVVVSAIYYDELTILKGAEENDYSEWRIFFFVEMMAGCIYILVMVFVILLRFVTTKAFAYFNIVVFVTQLVVFLTTAIVAIVLVFIGNTNNEFGKWNKTFMKENDIVQKIEEKYECEFIYPIEDSSYSEEDYSINPVNVKDIYVAESNNNETSTEEEEKENCEDAFTDRFISTIISHCIMDLAFAFSAIVMSGKSGFDIYQMQSESENQNEKQALIDENEVEEYDGFGDIVQTA